MKNELTKEEKRKEYMKNYSREYQNKNKKKISDKKKKYYLENKEKVDERNKKWMKENKIKFKKYLEDYYSNPDNIKRRRDNSKRWYESKSNEEYRKHKRKWENKKRQDDLNFRLKKNLRLRVNQAFKKYSKTGKIRKSKDYNIDYEKILDKLMSELPSEFNEANYHIDHIVPCCSFDLTDPKQVEECFSPNNHQWLVEEDNLRKISEDLKVKKEIFS